MNVGKKLKKFLCAVFSCAFVLSLCSCDFGGVGYQPQTPGSNLGGDNSSYGEALDDLGFYGGEFEGDSDVTVERISGSDNCYTLSNGVLTFSQISEDSEYSISGTLNGNIVIDVGDSYKFELKFINFSIVSEDVNPVTVLSGDKVTLSAKRDSVNYIYDKRDAIDESDETLYKGAIYSKVDLKIGGNGSLFVLSENNCGIHSKDDLEVKNLTLSVSCKDNALKGNDGVETEGGNLTLIATQGDGIKTSNSSISSKGNQKGAVYIVNSKITVYAACDGIDSAYDVVIEGEDTLLNVYTDKYSNYSEEVTAVSSSNYYIRYVSNYYNYSVKYYNSDDDYEWVNASYYTMVSSGNMRYYYFSFPKKTGYSKLQFYMYTSDMEQGQDEDFVAYSDYMSVSTSYDTISLTNRGNGISYGWTNYSTYSNTPGNHGGGGGMSEGNKNKGDHSTKGIKAANSITVNGGAINIKSYDDGLHANKEVATLENGEAPLGSVTVNGGSITVYSNDDGLHADGELNINGGLLNVVNSYEGLEGYTVNFNGGEAYIYSGDDGVNSTAVAGVGITLKGGFIYIYCQGDGLDANSFTSYSGISFEGGNAVIISESNGNSAIDTERGYKYSSGSVVAIMPQGGMSNEVVNCSNFSSVATKSTISFSDGQKVTVSGDLNFTFEMPCRMSGALVVLLNKNISLSC